MLKMSSPPPNAAAFSFGSSAFSTKSSAPAFNIDLINVKKSSMSSPRSSKRRFPSRPRGTNSNSPPPIFNPLRHSSTTPAKDDNTSTTPHLIVPTNGTTDPAGMNLKILLEKESNQVVFAESGTDFVDLLFSFLTLPIGTILRLLAQKEPKTIIGCMNNIFTSVENLDAQLLKTEACKDMLLHPRRSPEVQCSNKILDIEDSLEQHKYFYFCGNKDCREGGIPGLSMFPNVCCKCGRVMNQLATLSGPVGRSSCDQEGEGVFVKSRGEMFLISDDLQVVPGSSSTSIKLLKKLGIMDANELETRNVTVGPEEILQLLRLSLVSKTPLTHWILLKEGVCDLKKIELENMPDQLLGNRSKSTNYKKISLTLIKSKSENTVLYSEAEEDFIDFLFSFLTFPLGSTIKLSDGKSMLGCMDNIYLSVKELGEANYLKSEEHKNMLLAPKLAPFCALENSMFQIEESLHPQYSLNYYVSERVEWRVAPVSNGPNCYPLGKEYAKLSVVNPTHSAKAKGTAGGGAFVKGPTKFMVTDSLAVTKLSPISSISFLAKLKVPITDVDQTVVEMGEEEALDLLKAALISGRVLTDVFIKEQQTVRRAITSTSARFLSFMESYSKGLTEISSSVTSASNKYWVLMLVEWHNGIFF